MSEPPPGQDFSGDFAGDQTQPTDEILNALISPTKADTPEIPPPSEYEALTAQLAEQPHNPDGWRRLIELAESTGEIEKIRVAYDALLKQYPNTSAAQIAYINHFLNDQNTFGEAEQLFIKFLRTSPCVDLWKFYLTYVRRLNVAPATRDTVRKSYEFALNHVGQDKESGEIWNDYIQFLNAGETTTTWEDQQKMDALRKVYHRAVQIPLDNVEKLWQELEAFETNLNKITAKKFMADLSPAHMQARTVLRQLANHLISLYPTTIQGLYLPLLPTFDTAERTLVGKWKAYLKWEESNPLEIEEKDKATLITRIQGVYRKAVIRMRYYAEIWFMAYTWTNNVGKHEEAMSILKAGMEANPSSFLLNFTYIEAIETKKEVTEVHATFEKFLTILRANLDQIEQSTNANNATSENNTEGTTNGNTNHTNASTGITEAGIHSVNSSFNTQSSDDKPPKSSELEERRTEYGLTWIMYMRFGRRTEGVKSLRAVFGKARRDRWVTWQVYEAAAFMEYHCFDEKNVANRIFEKGLDIFGDEIDYVLRYLGFLISLNDEQNARALFERVIGSFSPERARPLWERWARYEYQYGDLEASQKLEKRIAEVYPNDPPIKRFAQRHMYLGIDAIASRDLGLAMARRATTPGASNSFLTRTETQQSLISNQTPASSNKRPPSPDLRKRSDSRGGDYGQAHKRQRAMSPNRGDRDRDRDGRWDGGRGRRFSPPPPVWEREDRGRTTGPVQRGQDREDEKPRGITLPPVIAKFIGELPVPALFDGPVFRTEDLMTLFRNAVIPSSNRAKSPPVPPPRSGGRPPPDYGPYQGPGGGRGRRY